MRASASMAADGFAFLRRAIAEAEGRIPQLSDEPSALSARAARALLPFAIPKLDRVLGGGLRRAALHEIRCNESRNAAAATGFAVAILARAESADRRPILWISETAATHEAGLPYGAGLRRFGIPPSRLIVVRVGKVADALWVFEEGLRCRGLAAVVTEIRGTPRQLDLTASRRLALRAREQGVTALLLRQTDRVTPGAATTRWLVSPRPAVTTDEFDAGIGNPAWRLTLERNRHGATGVFDVEWNHDRRTFTAAGPAHSLPLAPAPADRSPASPDVGEVVAFRRAS